MVDVSKTLDREQTLSVILLWRDKAVWYAEHYGRHAQAMRDRFGTNTVATAFNALTEPETAVAAIRRLNQDCRVELAEE